jgi:DNA-binding MarR family transcriptional regulator
MENKDYERLILNMLNFYIVFEKEMLDLMPTINNKEISPLLSRMLNEIHIKGRTTSTELSKRLDLSIPNTSRSLTTLHKLGYITKNKDLKDKRIAYITLSKQGVELVAKYSDKSQEDFIKKFQTLSDEEVDEMNTSFEKITKILIKTRELKNTL